MKICRYKFNDQVNYGIYNQGLIAPLKSNTHIFSLTETRDLSFSTEAKDIKFLPPITPSKIVCVGRNYADHAAELGNEVPKEPLLFLKAPSSIITSGEIIQIPSQSERVEHEGELAVVIRRDCKNLSGADNISEFVLGYTCLNDVTARDLQRKDIQFTRAKSFDTFCPVYHLIETDLDVSDIRVQTRINGEIKQDGRTSQMVFPIDFLVRYISNQMTLKAGDIIATGTPSGVSKLNSGDVCEVEIDGIGVLRNSVELS